MLIDSHCHLDAHEFGDNAAAIATQAAEAGVSWIVIPAVEVANFDVVAQLSHTIPGCVYALGIHPIYVPQAKESDLVLLRERLAASVADNKLVAVGEIGLDFFVPGLGEGELREKQEFFYSEQLKMARDFNLPVILHVRRSQDTLLKYLRRISVMGGLAHAFNGSDQQAHTFIDLGFVLGFGGAMTKQMAHLNALKDRSYCIPIADGGIQSAYKQIAYMVIKHDILAEYHLLLALFSRL
jgi:TatD DNase family protein